MRIKKWEFSENKVEIMGILNVTPDSFSDGGKFNELDKLNDPPKMVHRSTIPSTC